MPIKVSLFDMDGTIFDSGIDWRGIRDEIGLAYDGRPILQQLEDATPATRERGREILLRAEREGAENGELLPGAAELVRFLQSRGVLCVLITNNSRRSAETILSKHPLPFDFVFTRDEGAAKPHPGIFHRALKEVGLPPSQAVAIGDAHLDVIAAHRAGIGQIIAIGMPEWMSEHVPSEADYREVTDLLEARSLLAALLAD